MKKDYNATLHRARSTALGAAVSLALAYPAFADDTEIFIGRVDDIGQANVLFVLDTSGSMGSETDWQIPYDPDVVYPGTCTAGQYYWTTSSSDVPNCSGGGDGGGDDDDGGGISSGAFDEGALVCDAALAELARFGNYRDRMARWDERSNAYDSRWRWLNSSYPDQLVECRGDFGLHGDGSNQLEVYPASRTDGPWDVDPDGSRVLNWNWYTSVTIYSANYINYYNNTGNQTFSRLDVLKIVMDDVLGQINGLNVGMMRFSSDGDGGMVIQEVAPIGSHLESTRAALDALDDGGNTPLSETTYEAIMYMTGSDVDFGLDSKGNYGVSQPSVAGSRTGDTYDSPIVNTCQSNFVVLLTDGEPVSDTAADSKTPALPGFSAATGQTSCSGNCLDELAAYLHNHDLSDLPGDQTADVYTIGFHTDQQLLQDTADRGNGVYYRADDAQDLAQAFYQIVDEITQKDVTFTAPTVAVNTFNRLTHRRELYISMFSPTGRPHWDGNLKRYKLGNDDDGIQSILDATNSPAINPITETFYEDAKSFWTLGEPDGFTTTLGGLASRLLADRRVYTNTGGAGSDVALTAGENEVHEDNDALTASILGVSEGEREGLLRWMRGVDDEGNPLNILGDALHTRPIVVSYGGTEEDPDLALFYTTNDGYFHAVDPMAGALEELEVFSFIPHRMLDRMSQLKENEVGNPRKFYGVDGQITAWIGGDDGDNIVDDGERLYVYFGMRRGGDGYFALDVTDRDAPSLAWRIDGGSGSFAELGQTWSEMTPAKVRIGGSSRDVLLFGGGYDTFQDAAGPSEPDSIGRAVYMVDATTGSLLWWAANADNNPTADLPLDRMEYSIPSDLRVIDMNSDGYHDRIYVGDMGGQMWRFDIDNYENSGADDLVSGGVIADIGGEGAAGNRRIYYPPSVSVVADEYYGNFLAVAFGTGHRANPLGTPGKTVEDRFYMLRDPNILSPATDISGNPVYDAVTEDQLVDVTTNLDPDTSELNGASGWMIRLGNEEKVLAKAVTADGRIFFTTYRPENAEALSCDPTGAVGAARAYAVAIATGAPRLAPPDAPEPPLDPVGDPACQYRCDDTVGPIPPEPVLVFGEPEEPPPCPPGQTCDDPCDGIADVAMIIGTDLRDPSICTAPVRTYWFAEGDE